MSKKPKYERPVMASEDGGIVTRMTRGAGQGLLNITGVMVRSPRISIRVGEPAKIEMVREARKHFPGLVVEFGGEAPEPIVDNVAVPEQPAPEAETQTEPQED